MGRMRALVFHAPNDIRVDEVERPRAGVGEAVVRITLTTICGTDLHILRGEYPVRPGLVIGHEPVGVIEEIGPGVTGYAVGDRVFGFVDGRAGAHAELVAVPVASLVARVPEGWRLADAAPGMEGAHYAHAFLRVTGLGPGDRALVHGATGAACGAYG